MQTRTDQPRDEVIERMTLVVQDIVGIMKLGQWPAVDLADIRTVLRDSGGRAAMGIGEAAGPGRAVLAAALAVADLRQQLRGGRTEG